MHFISKRSRFFVVACSIVGLCIVADLVTIAHSREAKTNDLPFTIEALDQLEVTTISDASNRTQQARKLSALGDAAAVTGNYKEAVALYTRAISTDPSFAREEASPQDQFFSTVDCRQLLSTCERQRKLARQDPYFHSIYGALLVRLKSPVAEPALTKSIALKGDLLFSRLVRAEQTDVLKYVVDDTVMALKLAPYNPRARLDRGVFYSIERQYKKAHEQFELARSYCGPSASIEFHQGENFDRSEQFAKAVENYARSLALDSTRTETFRHAGHTLLAMKKGKQAIPFFDRALSLGSPSANACHVLRAYAKLQVGDYFGALFDFLSNTDIQSSRSGLIFAVIALALPTGYLIISAQR